MKSSDALSDALGIENIKYEIVESKKDEVLPVVEVQPELTEDADQDYILARKTFRSLIDKGNGAIDGITDLAKESESPRAYEVLATLMKTVADTTKDLFELQKKNKELKNNDKLKPNEEQRINVEKAVFVGSPSELLAKLKDQ